MGNIHSFAGSKTVEDVAADTEVVEAVELDIAAELAVSMVLALPGLVASAVSREPWCLMYILYSLDGVAVVRLTRLLTDRHSHVTSIKVQRGSSNRWRQGTFDSLIANRDSNKEQKMEALSRREEEEVMESAKTQALKACDEFVKSKSTPSMRKVYRQLSRIVQQAVRFHCHSPVDHTYRQCRDV